MSTQQEPCGSCQPLLPGWRLRRPANSSVSVMCRGRTLRHSHVFRNKWRIQNGCKGPIWRREFCAESKNVSPKFLRPLEVPQNGVFLEQVPNSFIHSLLGEASVGKGDTPVSARRKQVPISSISLWSCRVQHWYEMVSGDIKFNLQFHHEWHSSNHEYYWC